jgi:hypothetical protein
VILASILREFEDELFFATLDVALDIDQELVVSDGPKFRIPLRRIVIRYEELYPGHSVGAMDRYCELRWKAGKLLKKQGYIGSLEYVERGTHRWEGLLEVTVPDAQRFAGLLVALRSEENRRRPGGDGSGPSQCNRSPNSVGRLLPPCRGEVA